MIAQQADPSTFLLSVTAEKSGASLPLANSLKRKLKACAASPLLCAVLLLIPAAANAQAVKSNEATGLLNRANKAAGQVANRLGAKSTFNLHYKLHQGQELSWKVEHVTTTKTQIGGTTEEASARVETLSSWKVQDVRSGTGEMVFTNSIEAIKSWKKVGEEEATLYDSRTSKAAPDEYSYIADTLGEQRSRITIKADGEVLDRQSEYASTDFSTGDVTVPLPSKAIAIGHKWNVPMTFQSSNEHGAKVNLKARRCYELLKVKKGDAYISFRTEVLTPIKSHKVRSKILQKLIRGYVVWDIERGLPVQKRVQWDEKVQGYDGADSFLKYVGRMTVKLVGSQEIDEMAEVKREQTFTALTPIKIAPVSLRLRNERPELRR